MSKTEPPVSARTLSRHYSLLNKVAEKVLAIGYSLNSHCESAEAGYNQLAAMRSEIGERLRVIEGDIEKIQKVIGVLAKHSQVPDVPVVEPTKAAAPEWVALLASHTELPHIPRFNHLGTRK